MKIEDIPEEHCVGISRDRARVWIKELPEKEESFGALETALDYAAMASLTGETQYVLIKVGGNG